jgi:E3 ubiquitin-protein ligase BRE1
LRETQALQSSGEDRIRALESEVERLRLLVGESLPEDSATEDLLGKTEEELRKEIASLRGQASMLNTELSSMQSAFTKTRAQANKKASELSSLEEQVERYREAKQKIESTRFSERNALDTKKIECENLRRQSHKSGEIIAQLKESENRTRELCTNLEKQLGEYRESLHGLSEQNRMLQQHGNEAKIQSDGLQLQILELKKLLSAKDSALAAAGHAKRDAESEVASLKVELSAAHGMTAEWKEKLAISPGDEMDMYKVCGFVQVDFQ